MVTFISLERLHGHRMAKLDRTGRTGDTDRGRFIPARDGRLGRWVLLDGDRRLLAAGIALVSVLLFGVLGYRGVLDVGRTATPMLYLFSALIGGNITLITIVVTISQLILARELRTPRELRTELESAEAYRASVEEDTGRPDLPELPVEFLRVLLVDTQREAMALDSAIVDREEATLNEEMGELLSELGDELDRTLRMLESSSEGVFPALSTILDAELSRRINHIRWIRGLYGEELSETERGVLDDLEGNIEQLDVARQYLKTLHIEQELADATNEIMVTGLVATVVALAALVVTGYARTPLSSPMRLVFVPLAVGVNVAPLALLISHVMRITAVAKRTAAITPFLSPK